MERSEKNKRLVLLGGLGFQLLDMPAPLVFRWPREKEGTTDPEVSEQPSANLWESPTRLPLYRSASQPIKPRYRRKTHIAK